MRWLTHKYKWKDWGSWFAWHPVYLGAGQVAWLERVERRRAPCDYSDDLWRWEYR